MVKINLSSLRNAIRNNIKTVMNFIAYNYVRRENNKSVAVPKELICMFCGCSDQITKEHIIPRWIFEKDTEKFFNITLNGQNQNYNKTTIPACQKCNAELLNSLERYMQLLFNNSDPEKNPFSTIESENIICWLEIIDYKFHIMNISKKFLRPKHGEYRIP